TTASDSLATTDEATDETTDETTENTQEQAKEQEKATAATAESEGDATNPTAEAPKVAQKANVAAASKITGTWGTSSYTFDENTGVLTIGAGELSGYKESPWNSKKVDGKAIKKIVLSGKVVAPKDSRLLFSGNTSDDKPTNVTEIEGLSQLDTSKVTYMGDMFDGMSSITSLDVSSFDTSNVTDMSYMFYGMSSVTSLDVSSFDTSNVTDMHSMFNFVSSLTSLDVSNFDTSNVTDMGYMFRGMGSVKSLDLSNFDTSKVTDMGNMFADTPLKKLILGDTFKFVNGQGALTSAWKREDGKGKAYTAEDFMNNYGTGDLTAGTYVSATGWWGTSPYNFDENTGTLTIEAGELSGYKESPWFENKKVDAKAIKKIVLSGKVVAPENSRLLFSGNTTAEKPTNVTEIEGLSQLDTSNVTDMWKMFKDMSSITSLDVSGFDTSNVTDMASMFYGMSSVTGLDVSNFDTSNVTTMGSMFDGMSSVTSLDVSSFDTSKVTDMSYMFYGMSSVTSLDVSSFETSKVTDMGNMFAGTPLKKLTLGDTFKFVNGQGGLTSAWKREDGKGTFYSAKDFM
ncbi:TPA: BspA family leucine-rich repeat surface protein, partial [Enterococcus hirae]